MSWPARFGTIAQRATPAVVNKTYGGGYNLFGELGNNRSFVRLTPSIDTRYTTGSIWVSGSNDDLYLPGLINTNKKAFTRLQWGYNGSDYLNNLTLISTGSNWTKIASYRFNQYALDATNRHLWFNSPIIFGGTFSKIVNVAYSDIRCGYDQNGTSKPCLLALKTDGTLWGYGSNTYGQLGDNTTVGRNSPVQIGASTYTSFDIVYHSMAVRSDGTLWGWGYGANGRIGDNAALNRSVPVQIGTGTTWRQVTCGDSHTGAVKTDNTLWMWGYNGFGQLGQNNTTDKSSPVQVGTGTDWSAVMCGQSNNTFALKTNGTLWAWGANCVLPGDGTGVGYPQLGVGDFLQRSSPTQIGTGSNWTKLVFTGRGVQCAIDTNKKLWMWGCTYDSTAGGNNLTASRSPTLIDSTNGFVKILTSQNLNRIYGPPFQPVVALKSDGTLWGWGGLIGNGSVTPQSEQKFRSSPTQIGTGSNWTQKYCLWSPHFSTLGDVSVACMFINGSGQLWRISSDIRRIGTGSNWSDVTVIGNPSNNPSGIYMCLQSNGTRWGCGWNLYGGLGTGDTVDRGSNGSPSRLDSATNWSRIYGHYYSCLGIRTDGTLWSWGRNEYGYLGLGDTVDRSSPTQVGTDTNWKHVSTFPHPLGVTLAIKTNGTLWSWGYGGYGCIGNGTYDNKSSPIQIGAGTNWVSASVGIYNCFALKTDGTLWGWGYSTTTFAPGGLRSSDTNSPVQIGALTTWKDVSTGPYQTFLIGTA